jgi:hypothetical protein
VQQIRQALRRSRARTPCFCAAVAVTALLTACGASPSSTGPGGSANAGGPTDSPSATSPLIAFSQCIRAHSVPDFPDPQPGANNAKFPSAQQLGVSSSQLSAAENACQHLLPAGSNDQFPAAEVPLLLSGMREFSQCVRSHGVPNWPDPTTDSEGRPVFDLGAHGITRSESRSPQVQATEQQCQHLMPSALGGIPVGGS